MSKKRYHISLIVICILLLIATVIVLLTIDPQSCKYAYRLQATVQCWRGKIIHPVLSPPYNYTGKWVNWYDTGEKSEVTYLNGKGNGKITNWDCNSNIFAIRFRNKENNLELFFEDGKEFAKGIHYNNKKWYGAFVIQRKDAFGPNVVVYYLDYKEVSKDEYEKWAKETGGVDRLLKEHPEVER